MTLVDRGTGAPIVVVPGLQGRWEYQRATIDALAASHRVITFSLCDEPSSGAPFDADKGIDSYADQILAALDDRGIARAAVCGISFGGLIALRFVARHPDRASSLIMVSTPGPHWHLRPRHALYARFPWLFGPVFVAESPWRLRREIAVAFPERADRRRFVRTQLRTLSAARLSLSRMARRARLVAGHDRRADCTAVARPTLIVHGEPGLDHVVDTGGTSEYVALIAGAREEMLERTGHLGSVTRPAAFAAIVTRFLSAPRQDRHSAA